MKRIYYKMTPLFMAGTLFFAGLPAHAAVEDSLYSSRDLSGEIDEDNAVNITMNGDDIQADADTVTVSGSTVTITKEGTYILSGTLDNGGVIVDTTADEKVQLVLNGVEINSDTFAPIYVKQADKVFVTLAEGTDNTLTNGGTFTQIDNNKVDAVIFAKDDITLNGTGSLTISSTGAHGIVGKDEITITNGTYVINAMDDAINANETLAIADGTFKLNAESDGIHTDTLLQIDGGTFDITAGEGLEGTYIIINDGDISIEASDDGINATQKSSDFATPTIEINGGNIKVVMGQGDTDGLDANGDIVINGGTVDVTGSSTFDYDGTGTINGGTVIANGQQVDTLPSQMMGGHGGMGNRDGMSGFGKKGRMELNETSSEQL